MCNLLKIFGICLVFAGSAAAQTAVTTSGGTVGTVPVFNGTATLGNSVVTQFGNNLGVGTTAPFRPFTFYSNITNNNAMYAGFYPSSANAVVPFSKQPFFEIVGGGNPNDVPSIALLQINGTVAQAQAAPQLFMGYTNAASAAAAGTGAVINGQVLGRIVFFGDDGATMHTGGAFIDSEVYTTINPVSANAVPAALNLATLNNGPIIFYTNAGNFPTAGWLAGNAAEKMRIDYNGNVGIGTTAPGTKLEVNGNLKLSSGSGASITFADGTVQSTAYTGVSCGGDYAESVDVSGDRTKYEPGDILVLDADNPGKILKSVEAYSTAVSGIYSTKPGYVGRRQLTPKSDAEVPMAMIGIVPTKVSTENGPVRVGDLLVSSSTIGYAMKATDRSRMLGAVIGKAMGNLDSASGVIEVLVTLQ